MSSSQKIIEFGQSTKNVCMCVSLSILLIVFIMMTPINSFMVSSMIGRAIILAILGYTLFYSVMQTNKFSSNFKISFLSGDWDHMKTNAVCSWTLNVFIFMLFFSVLKTFF